MARLRGGYDFYYFGLRKNNALFLQGRGRELRHTAGVRLWSQPAPFGYDFELTGQLGTFGSGRIRAYYASFVVYYQLPQLPLTPTLRYATNVLSGDRDRNNPDLQTFNALYPRPYFGAATTPIGPGNLVDVHPGVELHFGKTMTLLADVDWLWRYSAEDAIYTPNLIPVIPSPGAPGPPLSERRFIGRQLNLEYFWQASRHFSAGFAYAWMPPGAFLRDQTPGRTLTYYRSTVLYQF